jgi:hypothetical protein
VEGNGKQECGKFSLFLSFLPTGYFSVALTKGVIVASKRFQLFRYAHRASGSLPYLKEI